MEVWKRLGVLGEGSYAIVYLAVVISQKEHTSNVVAVKSSKSCCYVSLQKEQRILELFKGCEEILQCYFYQDTIENGRRTYNLFMEYTPCGTLDDLIRKGSLSEKEVITYTRMLLKGLCSIHKEGIIHCDLKPANILLFPSSDDNAKYQLKIADFGLSNTIGDANVGLGEIMFRGTPIYMSPESIIGLMGTALDIWSLGCIVIEMMTGFPPWTNIQSIEELMWKLGLLQEVPKIPDELNWDCKNFLSKCFAKDHRERWSAAMLLDHPFIQKEYPTSSMFNPSSFFSYDIVSSSMFNPSSFFSYDIVSYVSH